MSKKVVLVIASRGYQEREYNETKKVLEDAGVEVLTASDVVDFATGHMGNRVKVGLSLKSINPALYAGVFIIGGPGALECLDTDAMYQVLSEFFAVQKPYGAICVSPRILSKAQVLRGKKATCWNGDEKAQEVFDIGDATLVEGPLVVDGTIVTADGPDAAEAFGEAILSVIK